MCNRMKIILDCDDVLYPCNQEAVNQLNREKGTEYSINDITKWGELGNELDERLKYFKDPEFILNLTPYEGAQAFVRRLSKIAEVFIATSVDPVCAGARFMAVTRDFKEIDPANILIGGRKDLLRGDIHLDDALHHFETSNVRYPVIFRQPWNKSSSGTLAVSEYHEFVEFVYMLQRRQKDIHPENPVYVLVGPTGSGKNEIAKELMKTDMFQLAKPFSTRTDKPDTYYTVTAGKFQELKENGRFLETSTYGGYEYGTSKDRIDRIIGAGKKALLMMDINGAIAMKQAYQNECVLIFVGKSKKECIRSILEREMSLEDKTLRLENLDAEFRNAEFCDVSFREQSVGYVCDKIKEISQYGYFQ